MTWIGLAINREVSVEALRTRTRLRRPMIIEGEDERFDPTPIQY